MKSAKIQQAISIHPPREGWDGGEVWAKAVGYISIHPPREGWDYTNSV